MTEIELKARIYDPGEVESLVRNFADYLGTVEKYDEYWSPIISSGSRSRPLSFRIRTEAGNPVVTFKDKRLESGIEINAEHEFSVSDAGEFRELLRRIGCISTYTKHKTSRQYRFGKILIEIVALEELGNFIEIESLTDETDTALVQAEREKLLSVLSRCGLGEKDLEPRFYSELLAERLKHE